MFTIDKKGSAERKRKAKLEKNDDIDPEEVELENTLFGAPNWSATSEKQASEKSAKQPKQSKSDRAKHAVWHDDDDDSLLVDVEAVDRLRKLRKTEEETELDGQEYATRLRSQFSKTNPTISWATRKSDDADELDEGAKLLQSSRSLLAKRSLLPQTQLEIERLKDANISDVSDAVIQSVRFHPQSNLMLSAGLDKRLKLFQVDGKTNPKIQGVFFDDMPIRTAEFSGDGSEIFVAGRRKFFYVYDLGAASIQKVAYVLGRGERSSSSLYVSPDNAHLAILGNCGHISLLSRRTKQWVGDLKMNHDARAAAFGPDGHTLWTAGGGGLVYLWDLRTRKCVSKLADEGSTGVSALALSRDGAALAVASRSGVVNLYDAAAVRAAPLAAGGAAAPAPRKTLLNMTTEVTEARFNGDGQVLGLASQAARDGLRLAHAASGAVFANWPTHATPLHRATSLDFSPTSAMLAIGNDRGKVLLYRLHHYAR